MAKFKDFFGVAYKEVYDKDFFGDPNKPGYALKFGVYNNAEEYAKVVAEFIKSNGGSTKIPYPMARGWIDIFCIDKGSLFELSRLCGIFSAMNMFVEIAIPTAVVLTFKRDEVKFFPNDSILKVLWGKDRTDFENKYNKDFNKLYNDWEENILFVHPIKLSSWKL